jgi:hypothetical protein
VTLTKRRKMGKETIEVTSNESVSVGDAYTSLFTLGFMPPSSPSFEAEITHEDGSKSYGSGNTKEEAIQNAK